MFKHLQVVGLSAALCAFAAIAWAGTVQAPACQKFLEPKQIVAYCHTGIYNCDTDPTGDECCEHKHDTLVWDMMKDSPSYTGKKEGTKTKRFFREQGQQCDGLTCENTYAWVDCTDHYKWHYTLDECQQPQ